LISLKWSMSNVASAIGPPSRLARGVLVEPAPVEQAGQRVGPGLVGESRHQQFVAALEHEHDERHTAHRDHHVQPASRVGVAGGQLEQRDRVPDGHARDDAQSAAATEEERGPEHGQGVEHGGVSWTRSGREGVGDEGHAERAEQRQRRAGNFALCPHSPPPNREQHEEQHEHHDHGKDRERRVAGQEALDRAVQARDAVDRGGRVGHDPAAGAYAF
jgi:hypothetical protein